MPRAAIYEDESTESDPLLESPMAYTGSSPDKIQDTGQFLETRENFKSRMTSLNLVLLTNFLSATGFSLLLTSMYQYVSSLGGGPTDYGLVVAAFSVGQLFGAPFFGYVSTIRSYKETFIVTIIIRFLGNLAYCQMAVIPLEWAYLKWLMIASRFVVGFGAGGMAVANAYVAGATKLEERLKWMGLVAATGGLGFVVGPLIGSAFSGIPTYTFKDIVQVDYMTSPALFACLLCIVNIVWLLAKFKETRSVGPPPSASVAPPLSGSINGPPPDTVVPERDYVAIFSLIFIYFGCYVIMSLGETVGLPLTEVEFKWEPKTASLLNGIIQGAFGIQSIIFFTLTGAIAKKFGATKTFLIGLGVTVVSQVIMIPVIDQQVLERTNLTDTFPTNTTTYMITTTVPHVDAKNVTAIDCEFYWCGRQKMLPLEQYIVGLFFIYIGFPIAIVMLFTLYSMALGPAPQGKWMGFLNASGSLARSAGPPVISYIFDVGGPFFVYIASSGITVVVFLFAVIMRKRFVPFGTRK